MKNRIKIVLFPVMAATIVLFTSACQADQKPKAPEAEPAKAETGTDNFHVETLNGVKMDFGNFLSQAELTVIYIQDPDCADCRNELKMFKELYQEYTGMGVQIAGMIHNVRNAEDKDALDPAYTTDVDYLQFFDSEQLKKQYPDSDADAPSVLFIDRKGHLLKVEEGRKETTAQWREEIEKYHQSVCIGDHPASNAGG